MHSHSVPITVRPMRHDEGPTFLDVVTRAIRGLATSHYAPEVVEGWVPSSTAESLEAFALNPDRELRLVAELDGAVVGIGALIVEKSELRACYVLPSAVRRGVGSALVGEIERIARTRGLARLDLAASLNAEPFYAFRGYQVRERSEVTLANGHRMPCVWMGKHL